MIDPNNIYFYIIFIIQILLISWYIPNQILTRMKTVLEHYPPEEYPKLYTKSVSVYKESHKRYKLLNRILFTMGFSLLSAMIMWDYTTTGNISPMIPWAYFMLQMVPLMWLEIKEYKYFKNMRASNTETKKNASIVPRKLFDFISPQLMAFAIAMLLAAFALVLYRYGLSSKSLSNIIIILATNLFFTGIIYWNIYGTKQDPYQSSEDRLKLIKVTVNSAVYISIGVSIFLAINMLIKIYDLSFLKTSVMSIYCQLIVWASIGSRLKHLKLENLDFSVYKKDEETDIVQESIEGQT